MKDLTPRETKTKFEEMTMVDLEVAYHFMRDWEKIIARSVLNEREERTRKLIESI